MQKSIIPTIELYYDNMTPIERVVADFFISNQDPSLDFSGKAVAERLFVSEAALTRFAKKCGFSGYREFIYQYHMEKRDEVVHYHERTQNILNDYHSLIVKTYSLINEKQIERIVHLLNHTRMVYFYGKGSSGLVALELKLRFMRLGLRCDALTDGHMIRMNKVLLNDKTVVIGLSISGETPIILQALQGAKERHAHTILMTANAVEENNAYCDEVVSVATAKNLNYGNTISPQFPLLILGDILYGHYINSDNNSHQRIFSDSLMQLLPNADNE